MRILIQMKNLRPSLVSFGGGYEISEREELAGGKGSNTSNKLICYYSEKVRKREDTSKEGRGW